MTVSSIYDQSRMPFLESLLAEKNRGQVSFHMPGHKGTMAVHPMLEAYLGGNPYPADLVEVSGVIDYLHSPSGALKEAQELAAVAYGADYSFFLINGSTVGNEASIMSVASAGQKIIMSRASHRSVYGGVVLSGAIPLYIEADYHPEIGFPLAVRAEAVQKLFEKNEDIVAVHITSPNYYGVLSDTAEIAKIAHEHGAALLVDEAHGSHLNFHPALPDSASRSGADFITQSTHKTQGALTQASMLHCNDNGFINLARVGQMLSLLQSSSPNSLLLATLDFARMHMATQGNELLERAINLSHYARQEICKMDGLWCYGDDLLGSQGIYAYDPTKLIISVTDAGYTGYEAYNILRDKHGIDGEFADLRQIIFSITIADTETRVEQLLTALRSLSDNRGDAISIREEIPPPEHLPELQITPREAYFAKSRIVPIEEAVGEIVSENIIPYPPGIPLLVPGEKLEQEHIDYLHYIMSKGSRVVGTEDKSLKTLRIVG